MNNLKWDNNLKRVAKKTYDDTNISLPDKEEIWNNIQLELEKDQQIQLRKNRLKGYSGLLAASILFLVFFASPTGSSAFSNLINAVNQWKDNVVQFVVQTDSTNEGVALTSAPGEEFISQENEEETILTETQIKEVSIEEAKSMLNFNVEFPAGDKLFETYELERVRVWVNAKQTSAEKMELAYSNGKGWFSVLQEKIPEHFSRSIEYDLEHVEVKEIMVGHYPAHIMVSNNIVNLEYLKGDNYITIYGALPEAEAIEIAYLFR